MKHTHIGIGVELRFVGVQTRWEPREEDGERWLVPLVNRKAARRTNTDPDDIRKQLFQMGDDEESALEFLNSVGLWSAEEDPYITEWSDGTLRKGKLVVGVKDSLLDGAFGHRYFKGRALPMLVELLHRERDRWRDLMHPDSKKLRKLFSQRPTNYTEDQDYIFALKAKVGNTLPIHLEWQGQHARAVIQPITGLELLTALAWLDVVTEAKVKVCNNAKCGIEYTRGGRKFCSWHCEHANTVRAWRKRKDRPA